MVSQGPLQLPASGLKCQSKEGRLAWWRDALGALTRHWRSSISRANPHVCDEPPRPVNSAEEGGRDQILLLVRVEAAVLF